MATIGWWKFSSSLRGFEMEDSIEAQYLASILMRELCSFGPRFSGLRGLCAVGVVALGLFGNIWLGGNSLLDYVVSQYCPDLLLCPQQVVNVALVASSR